MCNLVFHLAIIENFHIFFFISFGVFFQNGQQQQTKNVHTIPPDLGNLENETDVLDWMIDQKSDESIEEITREQLFEYIGSKDFLAVLFCAWFE